MPSAGRVWALLIGGLSASLGCDRHSQDVIPRIPAPTNITAGVTPDEAVKELSPSDSKAVPPAPESLTSGSPASEPEFEIEPPSFAQPVTAALALSPVESSDSGAVDVWVKALIAGGHHVYAPSERESALQPLSVDLGLPPGAEFAGDWVYPPAEIDQGRGVYHESVLLRRRIRSGDVVNFRISGVVRFQACNDDVCFPASEVHVDGALDN
jgi:hypothetical protein